MKRISFAALALMLGMFAASVHASFHNFRIDQVFSNADGTIQYVVLREVFGTDGEGFWLGHQLETTSLTGVKQEFTFQQNLPSQDTSDRKVLVATSGFAALNLVTPDFIVPNGFIPVGGGKLDYADGTDQINFGALPTDGATAITRNGTPVAATPTNFAGATTTLNLGGPVATGPDLNQYGLTGSWFEPATSGQGFEVEFFPNLVAPGTAFVQGAWFTFDVAPAGGADRERWYTFSGNGQSGAANVPVTIFRNVGGNFNVPPITSATAVGTGTLAFSDCANGTFTYTFTDGSNRSGTIPLLRLLPNVTCAVGTAPGTNADFALSGNWLDPATSGQGFVFDVNPNLPFMFGTWYTYSPAGEMAGAAGQRWYTAQGSYTPGTRSMTLPLFATTGGIFDQISNPEPSTNQVGTATITFTSCTLAQVQFNFTGGSSAGRSGTIALSRIGPVPTGCTQVASTPAPMMPGYPGYGPM
jgi:hypothetical protein